MLTLSPSQLALLPGPILVPVVMEEQPKNCLEIRRWVGKINEPSWCYQHQMTALTKSAVVERDMAENSLFMRVLRRKRNSFKRSTASMSTKNVWTKTKTMPPVIAGVEYRPIAGFEDYMVGNDGSVWSCKTGRMLAQHVNIRRDCDYSTVSVCLSQPKPRRLKTKMVSHLVCEAFHGPRPDGLHCCHNNSDPTDNRASNLRWGTREENSLDSSLARRYVRQRLTLEHLREIRRLMEAGVPRLEIAKKFGVSVKTIWNIRAKPMWKLTEEASNATLL